MPRAANLAAKTAFRQAFAEAHPFHIDTSPRRVWNSATFAAAARLTASRVCSAESPSSFALAAAAAIALKIT